MQTKHNRLIVMMGVSGCGKSTVGVALADRFNANFLDGDDLHPESNRQKMASGVPLTDSDREPWLRAIADRAEQVLEDSNDFVVACSALKKRYRDLLRSISHRVVFVHLHGPQAVLAQRLADRTGHFMPPQLLDSQYQTLESPTDEQGVIEILVDQSVEEILDQLATRLTDH